MKTPNKKILFLLFLLVLVAPLAALAKRPVRPKVDKIVVEKAERRMTLYQGNKVVKTYQVSLGKEPIGAKQEQGDHKTPEGHYSIDARNPNSNYHRALHISYPSARDREAAQARGVSPGGSVMIHGLPNSLPDFGAVHRLYDWTDGCIAVTNAEIEEIWDLVPNGTPIEILP
ncbi:MAG: L,D-transpeptidase family protein [bacterium]